MIYILKPSDAACAWNLPAILSALQVERDGFKRSDQERGHVVRLGDLRPGGFEQWFWVVLGEFGEFQGGI